MSSRRVPVDRRKRARDAADVQETKESVPEAGEPSVTCRQCRRHVTLAVLWPGCACVTCARCLQEQLSFKGTTLPPLHYALQQSPLDHFALQPQPADVRFVFFKTPVACCRCPKRTQVQLTYKDRLLSVFCPLPDLWEEAAAKTGSETCVGCQVTVAKTLRDRSLHFLECPNTHWPCPACNQAMDTKKPIAHFRSCTMMPVRCHCCSLSMPAAELCQHLSLPLPERMMHGKQLLAATISPTKEHR